MFSFTTLFSVLFAFTVVLAVPIPFTPPVGWATGYLEPYDTYHIRYLAIDCENKHNTTYFDQCCHPLLATETLENNRPPQCNPANLPSSVVSSAIAAATSDASSDDSVSTVVVTLTSTPTVASSTTSAPAASSSAAVSQGDDDCDDDGEDSADDDADDCEDDGSDDDDDDDDDCDEDDGSADGDDDDEDCDDGEDVSSAAPTPSSTIVSSTVSVATTEAAQTSSAIVNVAPIPVAASSSEATPSSTPAPSPSSTPAPAPSSTPAASPSSSEAAPAPTSSPSDVITGGKATFYFQKGNAGACGDFHSDSDFIGAIDIARYGNTGVKSPLCGRKATITNTDNGKSVTITMADACPTCGGSNDWDLSVAAFNAIANEATGIVPISWAFVN